MYSCYYCPILSLHRLGSDCSLVVSQVYSILKVTTIQAGTRNFSLNIIQLSLEGEVNSGGYIHRSSPTLRGIVVLVFTKSDEKKKRFFNFLFWNIRETTRHFSLRSQNSEYPRIFRVTGANQNARKLLSTDLVNTKCFYQILAAIW